MDMRKPKVEWMKNELSNAILTFAPKRRSDPVRGGNIGLALLRGARLVHSAAELQGATWHPHGERSVTGRMRSDLWRQVLVTSAIETITVSATGGATAADRYEGWAGIGRQAVEIPLADRTRAVGLTGVGLAPRNLLLKWASGWTPSTNFEALQLGYALRHAVAHGLLSPTQARQFGLAPLLDPLFDAHLGWTISLLGWAAAHLPVSCRSDY
jgi:hypothetical protein